MSCTAAHDQRTGTEPSVASRKDAASASEMLQHSASWAAALVSSVAAPDSMRDVGPPSFKATFLAHLSQTSVPYGIGSVIVPSNLPHSLSHQLLSIFELGSDPYPI